MKAQTRAILTPVLDGDDSITATERAAVFDILERRAGAAKTECDRDRVISRAEVARLLNCSPKTISRYAARGIIRPIRLGAMGRRASSGYSLKSVEALIEK